MVSNVFDLAYKQALQELEQDNETRARRQQTLSRARSLVEQLSNPSVAASPWATSLKSMIPATTSAPAASAPALSLGYGGSVPAYTAPAYSVGGYSSVAPSLAGASAAGAAGTAASSGLASTAGTAASSGLASTGIGALVGLGLAIGSSSPGQPLFPVKRFMYNTMQPLVKPIFGDPNEQLRKMRNLEALSSLSRVLSTYRDEEG